MSQNQSNEPEIRGSAQDTENKAPVYEAEIVAPESSGSHAGGSKRAWQRVYYQPGSSVNGVWMWSPLDSGGCLAGLITLAFLIACLGQFGILAAIGFLVFHTIGSIMGTLHSARQLMQGRIWNAWPWRIGNWLVSYIITAFLAGGFN